MERTPTPLTLRMAFDYKNHIDYRQNELGGFHTSFVVHDGTTFAEERIEDVFKTWGFSVFFDKESHSKEKQKWSVYIKFNETTNIREEDIKFYFSFGIEELSDSKKDHRHFFLSPNRVTEGNKDPVSISVRNNENRTEGVLMGYISGDKNSIKAKGIKNGDKQNNMDVRQYFYQFKDRNHVEESSLAMFEFKANLKEPFFIQLTYETNTETIENFPKDWNSLNERLDKKKSEFDSKFEKAFPTGPNLKNREKCSKVSMASLLGGLNYMYGPIRTSESQGYVQEKPMFSGTPSRTGFPRAFLWDDGFHNVLFCQYDKKICMSIIEHWLSTVFENGWIPREHIRGKECEEYANVAFLVQLEKEGNPPTLFLGIK
jgi:hypothetical protein